MLRLECTREAMRYMENIWKLQARCMQSNQHGLVLVMMNTQERVKRKVKSKLHQTGHLAGGFHHVDFPHREVGGHLASHHADLHGGQV